MFTDKTVLFIIWAVSSCAVPVDKEMNQNTQELGTGFFERCIEDLGCFQTGPPFFHPVHRPIVLLPYTRFSTRFWLFDRKNFTNKAALEPNLGSLQKSNFDPTLETKIIIHGYTTTLKEGDWKHRMKDALLNFDTFNVIMVDWTDSNGPPYPQAVANARVVGAQLAKLIQFLEDQAGIDARSVHLIGHSLGSHLAGWTGDRLINLGRITGLDPAGPYFQKAEAVVRLDISDAQFVDVIHTNGGTNFFDGLGILDPIGHLDFYPNGGVEQPGCPPRPVNNISIDVNGTALLGSSNSCNHGRAAALYIESIVNDGPCWFEATTCPDTNGCRKADVQVAEMGFHARKIPRLEPGKKFYLATRGHFPYCILPRSMQMQQQILDTRKNSL